MNKLEKVHNIIIHILTLVLAFVMIVPVYAYGADGGKISILYDPGIDGLESTEFKLFKVGEISLDKDGKPVIEFTEQVRKSNIALDLAFPDDADKSDSSEWNKDWLSAAKNLSYWIKTSSGKDSPEQIWKEEINSSSQYQTLTDNLSDGVYLLMGSEQLIGEYFWSPVPVLIPVYSGETQVDFTNTELKMVSRPVTYEHTVVKKWNDRGNESERPNSVRIALYCGNEQREMIELNDENNWTYTWKSGPGEKSWTVDEIMSDGSPYKKDIEVVSSEESEGKTEQFRITNTFSSPPPSNPPKTGDSGYERYALIFVSGLTVLAAVICLGRKNRKN